MTDSNAAWEKWIDSNTLEGVALRQVISDREDFEFWLHSAFDAGVKAAEAKADKPKWPESAVEADMKRMKELGVLWP